MSTTHDPVERDLKTRISSLLYQEALSDVTFTVDTPSEVFHCHKLILAAGSPVFQAMFYGKIPENKSVIVPDVSAVGFSVMLRYLYSDVVSLKNNDEALETAYISKKYLIKDLFKACESYLLLNFRITPESVCDLYEEASFLDMKMLKQLCLRFISRNSKEIFRSQSFISLSKESVMEILNLNVMNIKSEADVVEAIWQWGKHQCKELDKDSTNTNIREVTEDLLKLTRLSTISIEDLETLLKKCPILDISNELSLLWTKVMQKTKSPENLVEPQSRSISSCPRVKFPTEYRYEGSLNSFTTTKNETNVKMSLVGAPLTLIGFVTSFKPIPCYSSTDRSLDVEINLQKLHSNFSSKANAVQKAKINTNSEHFEELLLNDFVAVEEGDVWVLNIVLSSEGVRLTRCLKDEFNCNVGESKLSFFRHLTDKTFVLPIKEIIYVNR